MRTSARRLGTTLLTLAAGLAVGLSLGVPAASADPGAGPGADPGADNVTEARARLAALPETPLVTSSKVKHLSANPSQTGISGCFLRTKPLFVTSGLDSVRVYDVRDGAHPKLTGVLPSLQFENEAMNCGERVTKDGTRRFALIGVDLVQASPDDPQHVNAGGNELIVVEVTNPAAPKILSRTPGSTSTHTVACVQQTDCKFAYSAGDKAGTFSIFDLRRLSKPRELDANPRKAGLQPFRSPTAGHKWNFGGGYANHTGWNGTSIWDVSRPAKPKLVTTTGAAGRGDDPRYPGYNDFIHHNSFRPNARHFKPNAKPAYRNGNVLLVTEEDYEQTDCSKAGSFQTWWVKRLDGTRNAIVPLDKVELSDLGSYPVPQGAFCSAHWFDWSSSKIVAAGFYGGGTQLLDLRNPRDIKAYGHAIWGASEVWDALWLPVYRKGRMTSRQSNVVYSIDLVRGLDVYVVDVPGDGIGATPTPGVTRESEDPLSLSSVLPAGLVGAALALAIGVRRRMRTHRA
jgi:hypothetical protein